MLSPMRYPGGKGKMLPILMNYLDKIHKDTYHFYDAFVGGGSVALEVASKYPKSHIYMNDKDYWIYSFWDIVAGSETNKLPDLLKLVDQPATLKQFYKLKETATNDKLECAYKAIFLNRTCFSGIFKSGPIGGKEQKSKYTVDCRYNASKLKKKILICNKLLQGRTSVSNKDIFDFLEEQDNNATIYLDPPYYKVGHQLYQEYMKPQEHLQLSNILKNKNNWLLSYDNCEEIIEMYNWADISYIDTKYSISGFKSEWKKCKEVLIKNIIDSSELK